MIAFKRHIINVATVYDRLNGNTACFFTHIHGPEDHGLPHGSNEIHNIVKKKKNQTTIETKKEMQFIIIIIII